MLPSILCTVGLLWSCAPHSTAPKTPDRAAATPLRDTHERLQAVLWMQTAAEYWVQASAAYRTAQTTLDVALKDTSWTAALEQAAGYEALPAAVILDLDETVLDNSPSQAQLVLDRAEYTTRTWDEWVEKASATAIPGVTDFLALAQRRGVKIFFITNRMAAQQAATLKNLAALGITASDDTVLCVGENGWTSDKTARRASVAKSYRVLMLVGDDLNDFVSTANLTPPQRIGLAMTHTGRWGSQWILIANPLYGSWERALYPDLQNPTDGQILERKRAAVKGFRQ